jgi:PaaX-like protein
MPFAPQDLKRAHKSRPLGVLFFALGLLSHVEDSGVDSALLLRATSELGLPEAASRAAILRLRREGMLLSERDGRRARYSIAPPVAAVQQRWNDYFRAGLLLGTACSPDCCTTSARRIGRDETGYAEPRSWLVMGSYAPDC